MSGGRGEYATQPAEPECSCHFVDVGVGPLMKVSEDPECQTCTEFGYAVWASRNGTGDERRAARVYLDEVLGERR